MSINYEKHVTNYIFILIKFVLVSNTRLTIL